MTMLFNWSSLSEPWRPKRRQNIITALKTLPQGWVSACKHQCTTVITMMWTEFQLVGLSLELHCWWQLDHALETKALVSPPPRWVSAQLLYVFVSAWQRSRRCGQNLCSPFLWAVRLFTLHWIRLDYAAQFFPYQECNHSLAAILEQL